MRYIEFANEPLINHKIKYPVISIEDPETDPNLDFDFDFDLDFDFQLALDLELNPHLNVEAAIAQKKILDKTK